MPNRREPLNLIDFTGGLNLRSSQFELAENESPEMANVSIDPLGGIYTRNGWERWNADNIVSDPTTWDPRRALLVQLADGTDLAYIAANQKLFYTNGDSVFIQHPTMVCSAESHMADFAVFGDTTYIACGRLQQTWRRVGTAAPVIIPPLSTGNFNDDYLNPLGNVFPKAKVIEAHSGYVFAGFTNEAGVDYPHRLRWSHPTSQEDWATDDFIDIGTGGSRITALMSFEDHLLIFKKDSLWALYGYDADSWQLVQKDSTIGARGPQGVTRNEQAVFFYSPSDLGGIYVYGGERPEEISVPIRRALEDIIVPELTWVGWVARRLWVTLPWNYAGPTDEDAGVFVFDPTVGDNGAWTFFESDAGALGPLMGGSNVDSQVRPMGVLRDTDHPCVVRLDATVEAGDLVADAASLGASLPGNAWEMTPLITNDGREILASGQPGFAPFLAYYRTPWLHAGWPTRKKSWRRPDFVMKRTDREHAILVESFRDYEELNARRRSIVEVPTGGNPQWGHFVWNDGSQWGAGRSSGAAIRRGSSFGMCRALQIRVSSYTRGTRWGIDAIVAKYVMRRFT